MNRSKIEWCDYTYNPMTGCLKECPYCYAKGIANRFAWNIRLNKAMDYQYQVEDGTYILDEPFIGATGKQVYTPFGFEPTYHRYRLDTMAKLKQGQKVFVGSMADIFGDWVKSAWIEEIFRSCSKYDDHVYMFLTKNPDRYKSLEEQLPNKQNMWYGYTVTTPADQSVTLASHNTFISVEPMLEPICITDKIVDWVIIGAETGKRKGKVIPEKEWIDNLVADCDRLGVPVFMKDSLIDIVGESQMRRQYPEGMKRYIEEHKITAAKEKILYGDCNVCRKKYRKNEMVTLLARCKRGQQPKQVGFVCKECAGAMELQNGFEFNQVEGFSNE